MPRCNLNMGTSHAVAIVSIMAIVAQAFTTMPLDTTQRTRRMSTTTFIPSTTVTKPLQKTTTTTNVPTTKEIQLTTVSPRVEPTTTIVVTTQKAMETSKTEPAMKMTSESVQTTQTTSAATNPAERNYLARTPSRLDERLEALDCDIPLLPAESRLWRGNETHELTLPITVRKYYWSLIRTYSFCLNLMRETLHGDNERDLYCK
jgi:hypothetical protein